MPILNCSEKKSTSFRGNSEFKQPMHSKKTRSIHSKLSVKYAPYILLFKTSTFNKVEYKSILLQIKKKVLIFTYQNLFDFANHYVLK